MVIPRLERHTQKIWERDRENDNTMIIPRLQTHTDDIGKRQSVGKHHGYS